MPEKIPGPAASVGPLPCVNTGWWDLTAGAGDIRPACGMAGSTSAVPFARRSPP
jgi:hypothetical protein